MHYLLSSMHTYIALSPAIPTCCGKTSQNCIWKTESWVFVSLAVGWECIWKIGKLMPPIWITLSWKGGWKCSYDCSGYLNEIFVQYGTKDLLLTEAMENSPKALIKSGCFRSSFRADWHNWGSDIALKTGCRHKNLMNCSLLWSGIVK